jgi:hypothetical protein
MSASKPPHIPAYRLHKQSGQAVVTLPDSMGGRRDVLLGTYGTKASKSEYKRVVLDWESNDRRLPDRQSPADLRVEELLDRYWQHAQEYYRRADGSQTQEVACIRYALRPLNYLHGAAWSKEHYRSRWGRRLLPTEAVLCQIG